MPQGSAVGPSDQAPSSGPWRLAILSLGDASAGLIPALRHVSPLPAAELAALLFRAPSILAEDLSREVAETMAELLRRTGLEVAPLHRDEPFEGGKGVFEVALAVADASRLGGVAALICELLGCSPERAREMLCASPASLMGAVSAATVEALRRRFADVGAELDVSRPEAALYDLYIEDADAEGRAEAARMLEGVGVEAVDDGGALLAAGLGFREAQALWGALRGIDAPVRLLNRDFQRFDVCLERTNESAALLDNLAARTGLPPQAVGRFPAAMPRVVLEGVDYFDAIKAVARLGELGAEATARPVALQRFVVALSPGADAGRVTSLLRTVGGLDEEQAAVGVGGGALPGRFGKTQAAWLRAELERIGVEATVTAAP